MRQIVYSCDNCTDTLSDGQKIERPHISVQFGQHSGLFKPHDPKSQLNYVPTWHCAAKIPQGIYQFCDTKCLGAWLKQHLSLKH